MTRPFGDHIEFFRQFRQRFQTTGAVAPSSRFLAHAMLAPLRECPRPARILEVGPGTGAVTRHLVRLLQPGDRLDLVEVNEVFANLLVQRFAGDRDYQRVAEQSQVHTCPLQQFQSEAPYDCIISGLPLNNFSVELVTELFDRFLELLKPDGVLSYFEYMYVRSIRGMTARGPERVRLRGLNQVLGDHLARYRYRRSWVFVNVPPAWVQHLRVIDVPR